MKPANVPGRVPLLTPDQVRQYRQEYQYRQHLRSLIEVAEIARKKLAETRTISQMARDAGMSRSGMRQAIAMESYKYVR